MSQNPFPTPEQQPRNPAPHDGLAPVVDPAAAATSAAFYASQPAQFSHAPQPLRRSHRRGALIGGGIALVVLLGLGGGAAWAMNAHGDYAYQHVASGATAYAALNMSPSMMQDAQAVSFLAKLPKVDGKNVKDQATSSDSVAKAVVDGLAPGNELKDYSWAGNRYAVVLYGGTGSLSSSTDNAVVVIETTDQVKAVNALAKALAPQASEGSEAKVVKVLDGNYVAVGTQASLDKATSGTNELSDDASFKKTYTTAGDPLSYWYTADSQVATGGVRADWGSMKLEATTTGGTVAVSAAAQAANKQLTSANSVASPYVNVGLADPKAVLGPDSPAGKALLGAAGTLSNGSESTVLKQEMTTLLGAVGDNISFSANENNGRILLHGATESNVDNALTQLAGRPVTLSELSQSYSGEGTGMKAEDTGSGLLLTYGSATTAVPENMDKVAPGIIVAKVDLDRLLAKESKNSGDKWGTVSLSETPTADGTKTDASWDLP